MKHLSPAEFGDLAEDRLSPERAAHLRACETCAHTAAETRQALLAADGADIPEPSPLFWEHFRSRVSRAVAEAGGPSGGFAEWMRPAIVFASVAVLAIVVFGSHPWTRATLPDASREVAERTVAPAIPPAAEADDPALDFLADAATELPSAQAQAPAVAVRPAAVDRAVNDLSPAERDELGRLLQSELKRAGA